MSAGKEKGFWSSLWDSLSSVRLTIPLLIILAVASIFGTVIPQNASLEEYLQVYKVTTYKILKILGFLDMYHAGWFFFLLALLSLNLLVCSLKRFRSVLKFFVQPEIRLEEGQWKAISPSRKVSQPLLPEKGLTQIQETLSRVFGRPQVLKAEGSHHLFAEKGKFSRLGFYFIHLSILVILTGALIGLYFGFRGYMNIVEGETTDRVALRSGQQTHAFGFKVKLDKFNVSFYSSGAPQEFKSTVTILEGDRKVLTEPIRVNHPLTYQGISFYQSSYGLANVEKVVLTIQDRNTGKETTVPGQIGTRAQIPGSSSAFVLTRFISDLRGGGPAFQVVLSEPNRPMETFWILQYHPEIEASRPGRYYFRVKEIEPQYYSGLQVTRDPGVWVVWSGCFLMMAGFYLAFFVSHRRVWVRLTEKKGGTLVEIAGSSRRDRLEFEKELEKIEQAIKGIFPKGEKELKKREDQK
ncbi:MAG: cytochrome c biogenesis protein ResB [Thermodesulfobacteriota bacterium]